MAARNGSPRRIPLYSIDETRSLPGQLFELELRRASLLFPVSTAAAEEPVKPEGE